MGVLTLEQVVCTPLEPPTAPPEVTVPFLGTLKEFRKSLYQLPDPSEYLLKLLSSLNVVMLPIRQFVELVEIIFLFKDCLMALPNAIMTLSPKPIFDCLKKLLKKLQQLIMYIPPLPYLRSLVDLVGVMVLILDELVYMLLWLDQQITQYQAMISEALHTGDQTLVALAACKASQMNVVVGNAVDILKLLGPLIRLLLEPIIAVMPNAALQAKMSDITDIGAQLDALGDSVRNLQADAIQPLCDMLGVLVTTISTMQSILVTIYNVVAGIVGKEPMANRTRPTTVNF